MKRRADDDMAAGGMRRQCVEEAGEDVPTEQLILFWSKWWILSPTYTQIKEKEQRTY